jgi:xylan 1,4-beta-xylosidase
MVRPWRAMIGCEHLSLLLSTDRTGGRPVGAELRAALRRAHDELGVRAVRAHGILGDDLGVYRELDGRPRYDFAGVDRVYDIVRELGMRPVVELGFMPRDLARDPHRTVFTYAGIISPPKDWDRWADLVRALAAHLVDRYGRAEVRDHWAFEVWNEPNLSVFWSGPPEEYWRLYRITAAAIKDVDPRLRVGGPASAAVGWIDDQVRVDAPVDFLSTHVYGTPPLDLRPLAGGRALLWTEWGVTARHGNRINDTVFAATFLLRGMRSAAGRLDALAPWVVSDHFEELGRPPRLLHGGFGLLTVGNLAKPKFWALALAQRLGDTELPVTLDGDGAGSLVEAWAARAADGTLGVLLWNGTLDHGKVAGDPALGRRVTVRAGGVTGTLRTWRVDAEHHDISRWSGGDWPDEQQWQELAAADRLGEAEPPRAFPGTATLELPMPGIAYLEITPPG